MTRTPAGLPLLTLVLALGGCASDGVDRRVKVESHDFTYAGLETFTGVVGEKVEFELTNKGPAPHEFVVIDPDGMTMGGIGPTAPQKVATKKLSLKKPGTYTFACFFDDHLWRDMKGTFEVR